VPNLQAGIGWKRAMRQRDAGEHAACGETF
jgi:hypothetical protein